jgi:hypothetical protein
MMGSLSRSGVKLKTMKLGKTVMTNGWPNARECRTQKRLTRCQSLNKLDPCGFGLKLNFGKSGLSQVSLEPLMVVSESNSV